MLNNFVNEGVVREFFLMCFKSYEGLTIDCYVFLDAFFEMLVSCH